MGDGIQDSSSRSGDKGKRKDDSIGNFGRKKEAFREQISSDLFFFFSFKVKVHTVGKG